LRSAATARSAPGSIECSVFSSRFDGLAPRSQPPVTAFPLIVRSIQLGIENVDRQYEEVAATLGARPIWVLLTVTLPLALPGILAGLVIGFAKALGEFGATITFVSNIPEKHRRLRLASTPRSNVPEATRWRCGWPFLRRDFGGGALCVRTAGALAEEAARMSLDVNVRHSVGRLRLDLDVRVGNGLTALVGPSGSGKTTLLNIIAGLDPAGTCRDSRGRRRAGGHDGWNLAARSQPPHRIRVPGAEPAAPPHRPARTCCSVDGSNAIGPADHRWTRSAADEPGRSAASLSRRGCQAVKSSGWHSGRALLAHPQLLLLDEPLAAVDQRHRAEILPFLDRLRRDHSLPRST
jgi:hypothetical protein